jgi:hypothetical protein
MDHQMAHAAAKWIEERCPDLACPACGGSDWSGAELAYHRCVDSPGLPADSMLMMYVVCEKCAHAMAFSAVAMGLVPGKSTPPNQPS